MTIYDWLILACWIVFVATWTVSGFAAKGNASARGWGRQSAGSLGIVVLVVLALFVPAVRHVLHQAASTGDVAGAAGVVLCALGVGLAIWARLHLGRNWGMPMSRQANPELVSTGPYAAVRHPIYTGMLIAMLGSAVGANLVWLLPLILFGAYFIRSARDEEKFMLEQLPGPYSAYMKRTAMLLPFVL